MAPDSSHLLAQVVWLFVLSIPVACCAWTVTHEEIFREPREFCQARCKDCRHFVQKKFFYLFTCEYCFSHYVTAGFVFLTRYRLLLDDWRGFLLSLFAVVWVANIYMSIFSRMRVDIRAQRAEADVTVKELEVKEKILERIGSGERNEGDSGGVGEGVIGSRPA